MNHYYFNLVVFTVVFLLSSCSFLKTSQSAVEEKQIKVVLLYDDVSSLSSMDLEMKILDSLRTQNMPCTFGVIPYASIGEWRDIRPQEVVPLPIAKINMFKDAMKSGLLNVVLHGYSHQAVSQEGKCGYTEFCGLEYGRQEKTLAQAKNYLERNLGNPVFTFYPTWNSYDQNTIRAIENLGFKTIFGMEYGYADKNSKLNFLPFTCDFIHLRTAITSARRLTNDESVIVVLLRSTDIQGINRSTGNQKIKEFQDVLSWITSQNDIQLLSVDQAITAIDDLSAQRFLNYNSFLNLSHYLYPLIPTAILKNLFPIGVYLSSDTAVSMKAKLSALFLFFYLFLFTTFFITSFFLASFVFLRLPYLYTIAKYGAPILLLFVSTYIFRVFNFSHQKLLLSTSLYYFKSFYYKLALLFLLCLSFCLATLFYYYKYRKNSK